MSLASVWKFIKEWAKTLAAFVAGVVTTMILNVVNGSAVWPQTRDEWLQYALTSFGAAIAVALTRNKITQKQLDKDPDVVGGTVVSTSQVPSPQTPPWAENVSIRNTGSGSGGSGGYISTPARPADGTYRNPWQ